VVNADSKTAGRWPEGPWGDKATGLRDRAQRTRNPGPCHLARPVLIFRQCRPFRGIVVGMSSLSDSQLQTVMLAASALPTEKRGDFLQRISATLAVRHGYRFSDADVARACNEALHTLVQHSAHSAA